MRKTEDASDAMNSGCIGRQHKCLYKSGHHHSIAEDIGEYDNVCFCKQNVDPAKSRVGRRTTLMFDERVKLVGDQLRASAGPGGRNS